MGKKIMITIGFILGVVLLEQILLVIVRSSAIASLVAIMIISIIMGNLWVGKFKYEVGDKLIILIAVSAGIVRVITAFLIIGELALFSILILIGVFCFYAIVSYNCINMGIKMYLEKR